MLGCRAKRCACTVFALWPRHLHPPRSNPDWRHTSCVVSSRLLVLSRCIGAARQRSERALMAILVSPPMLRPTASVPSTASDSQGLSLEPATVSDWQALRRAINVKESLLRERTFKWLATLPAHVRPMVTARQYARIVNRIGDLWSHCEFTRLHFQSLLIDRRPGREGFPSVVRHEL